MKKTFTYKILAVWGLLLTTLSFGQTQGENYIYVQEPTDPVTSVSTGTAAIRTVQYFDGLGRPKQTIQVKASPDQSGGTSHKNLVTKTEYDGFGRQSLDYLPVPVSQSGTTYLPEATVDNAYNTFYDASPYNTDVFYSEKTIESSPLNRVMKQAAPGDDWAEGAGHEIEFEYLANTAADAVRIFKVNLSSDFTPSLSQNHGNYEPNTLYKTATKDENGHKIYEFKNKQGQVVLKRTTVTTVSVAGKGTGPGNPPGILEKADTYYVYDIYGNLTFVFPPLLSAKSNITTTLVNNLGYRYKYDERNRLVEKTLPGKKVEYMVYDKQDRLVATQDANLGATSQWLFTKYDKFGRVVYTGLYGSGANRASLQETVNGYGNNNESRNDTGFTQNGISVKYTKTAFPTTIAEVLTVNYYDYYGNIGFTPPSSVLGVTGIRSGTLTADANNSLKGLPVASLVRVLGSDDEWESTFTVYDRKSRPVQTYKQNHLGGYTKTSSELNFRGLPLQTETRHKRESADDELVYTDYFTYDNMERLLTHKQAIVQSAMNQQLIASNQYDKLGQLISKKVGGVQSNAADRWQEVNYKYNIRGWLTNINEIGPLLVGKDIQPPALGDDLFAFRINYNMLTNDGDEFADRLYNGNIAQTLWQTSTDNVLRGYVYNYDQLNRLRSADFYRAGTNPYSGAYGEYLAYDINGNITKLLRHTGDATGGQIDMDDLTYTYLSGNGNTNRLLKVTDAVTAGSSEGFSNGSSGTSNDYTYDDNGNMTADKNKGITEIIYNYLNLPTNISFANGSGIEYIYNAAGQKITKKVYDTPNNTIKEVDYLDGFQYAGGILQFFPHSEGYVNVTTKETGSRIYNYVYNYTDHLGNIRMSYTKDPLTNKLRILEENHYYPFGLKHSVYNTGKMKFREDEENGDMARPVYVYNTDYQYKYQGQERQDELGLNWDSFKWRNYDYAIGRFMSVDPLASQYPYNSPYAIQENKMGLGYELEGLELVHARGNSPEFRAKFAQTVKYMNEKGTSGMLSKLNEQSKTTLVDNTGGGQSYYDSSTESIHWDSTLGLETSEGIFTSPATNLNHEIDHALQDKLNPDQFAKDANTPDAKYDDLEEKRVITGSEQETALKHGEIKEGQITRDHHSGEPMEMPDPTSTENATYSREPLELEPAVINGGQ